MWGDLVLKAVNIRKKFGENVVLEDFSHEFTAGRITAVLGQSGGGKTTLLSILMGLLAPDGGEVVREGRISAIFQENRLCENLTAGANIRLVTGKRLTKAEIAAELAAVGLEGCADKPVRELSGGMKRRTAMVRALLAEYDILFADEPFKGLDEDTKRIVMSYFKEKTSGKTVVFVTHDNEECDRLADEIIRL